MSSAIKSIIKNLFVISLFITLVSCYNNNTTPTNSTSTLPGSGNEANAITGTVTLGPIVGATVKAYDFSTGTKGAEIAASTTVTDSVGEYALTQITTDTPILVCSSGGGYDEPASTPMPMNGMLMKASVEFVGTEQLCAVANYTAGQAQTVVITYYTNLAYALAIYKLKDPADMPGMAGMSMTPSMIVDSANKTISDWVGVNIISTIPRDTNDPNNTTQDLTDEYKYGLANAAVSSLIKEVSMMGMPMSGANAMEFMNDNSKTLAIMAFEDLKADGWLDGKATGLGNAGILQITNQAITKLIYRDDLGKNISKYADSDENKTSLTSTSPATLVTVYSDTTSTHQSEIFIDAPMDNVAPIAVNDPDANAVNTTITAVVGNSIVISVLDNDTDADNDPLSAMMVSMTQQTMNASGDSTAMLDTENQTIIYNPGTLADGQTDTFTYYAFDGYQMSVTPATVSISVTATPNTAPVASVTVVKTVTAGDTINLLASTLGTDAEKNPLKVVNVTMPTISGGGASDSTTALVPNNGSIDFTAGSTLGDVTFNFTLNDGLADSNLGMVTVTVIAAPLVVSPDTATIVVGATQQFSAAGGAMPYTWSVDDMALATIDAITGLLTGVSPGTVIVTATDANGIKDSSGMITITAVANVVVAVTPDTTSVVVGATQQFSAAGGAMPYTWSVDDMALATIDAITGLLTGVSPGTVIVTATDANGIKDSSGMITIEDIITVSPDTAQVLVGGSIQFSATGGNGTYSWVVTNFNAGSINSSGLFTANQGIDGMFVTTTIIATDSDGHSDESGTIVVRSGEG